MGFSAGSWAKIWEITDRGNFRNARISTSRKNQSGEYEKDFSGFVGFFGKAKEPSMTLNDGDTIKITECSVTTKWDADAKKEYINYNIFAFETRDGAQAAPTSAPAKKPTKTASKKTSVLDDEEGEVEDADMPF